MCDCSFVQHKERVRHGLTLNGIISHTMDNVYKFQPQFYVSLYESVPLYIIISSNKETGKTT